MAEQLHIGSDSGGRTSEYAVDGDHYVQNTGTRVPVDLARGEGCYLFDEQGNRYLDLVAGIAVCVLGHSDEVLAEAISKQARTLMHTSNLYWTRPQVDLARELVQRSFPGRVFFSNSGAEANEAAIKLARKWGKLHRDGAYEIISTDGSFHGRTLAAINATGQPKYQKPFYPALDGFQQVPYNDLAAMRAATTDKTVAVLVEPIQGESGVRPADPAYLTGLRQWCDEQNLLLILDEVQTGMGRTGRWWAWQHYGVQPDVMTVAKALGGGIPIGATIANERADCFTPGDHGSTFGGNPLAATAALTVISEIERRGLVEHALEMGEHLAAGFQQLASRHRAVAGERGLGLMRALVLNQDLAPLLLRSSLDQGAILNAVGQRVLRMVPPLVITAAQLDEGVAILDRGLEAAGG
ncbi:MAG: acetylornithine/succinylornithine family transaminase [Candidatus Dormibacteria bacterium]